MAAACTLHVVKESYEALHERTIWIVVTGAGGCRRSTGRLGCLVWPPRSELRCLGPCWRASLTSLQPHVRSGRHPGVRGGGPGAEERAARAGHLDGGPAGRRVRAGTALLLFCKPHWPATLFLSWCASICLPLTSRHSPFFPPPAASSAWRWCATAATIPTAPPRWGQERRGGHRLHCRVEGAPGSAGGTLALPSHHPMPWPPVQFIAMAAFLPTVAFLLMINHVRFITPYGYFWSCSKFTLPIIALAGAPPPRHASNSAGGGSARLPSARWCSRRAQPAQPLLCFPPCSRLCGRVGAVAHGLLAPRQHPHRCGGQGSLAGQGYRMLKCVLCRCACTSSITPPLSLPPSAGIGLDLAASTLVLPVTSRQATRHRIQV